MYDKGQNSGKPTIVEVCGLRWVGGVAYVCNIKEKEMAGSESGCQSGATCLPKTVASVS